MRVVLALWPSVRDTSRGFGKDWDGAFSAFGK